MLKNVYQLYTTFYEKQENPMKQDKTNKSYKLLILLK
jgi:hypothetical protein